MLPVVLLFLSFVFSYAQHRSGDYCKILPRMDPPDLAVFDNVTFSAKYYFEFGAGGSTVRVACKSPKLVKIYSVDGDQAWLDRVSGGMPDGLFVPLHIDIGPIAALSFPKDNSKRHLWPNYSYSVMNTAKSLAPIQLDTILIDGRFRVACALQAMLASPRAEFLWHDFLDRPWYHVISHLTDLIQTGNTLIHFRRKEHVADWQIEEMIDTFRMNPK